MAEIGFGNISFTVGSVTLAGLQDLKFSGAEANVAELKNLTDTWTVKKGGRKNAGSFTATAEYDAATFADVYALVGTTSTFTATWTGGASLTGSCIVKSVSLNVPEDEMTFDVTGEISGAATYSESSSSSSSSA